MRVVFNPLSGELILVPVSTAGGGGGGATTFIALTDVPSSYAGAAGKGLRVNAGMNGLEYVVLFSGAWADLSGVPATFPPSGHTHPESDVTGLVADLSAIAAALAALSSGKQDHDTDLDDIAALVTHPFGRALLTLANAPAIRAYIGAGVSSFSGLYADLSGIPSTFAPSAHTHPESDVVGLVSDLAGKQNHDLDLDAIALLATDPFGRALLTLGNAMAIRAYIGAVIGTDVQAHDPDLDAIAALATDPFGRALLTLANAPAVRAYIAASPIQADAYFFRGIELDHSAPAAGNVYKYNPDHFGVGLPGWELTPVGTLNFRQTFNITATALGANARISSSVPNIAATYDILRVVSNLAFPVRLRLYSSAAFRDADATRSRFSAPVPGSQHGVIMDLVLNAATGYIWAMSPLARGGTLPAVSPGVSLIPDRTIYYTIDNLDIVPRNIDLTVTYLQGE